MQSADNNIYVFPTFFQSNKFSKCFNFEPGQLLLAFALFVVRSSNKSPMLIHNLKVKILLCSIEPCSR